MPARPVDNSCGPVARPGAPRRRTREADVLDLLGWAFVAVAALSCLGLCLCVFHDVSG